MARSLSFGAFCSMLTSTFQQQFSDISTHKDDKLKSEKM